MTNKTKLLIVTGIVILAFCTLLPFSGFKNLNDISPEIDKKVSHFPTNEVINVGGNYTTEVEAETESKTEAENATTEQPTQPTTLDLSTIPTHTLSDKYNIY